MPAWDFLRGAWEFPESRPAPQVSPWVSPGSAARLVEPVDQLRVVRTPGTGDLRFFAVAAGPRQHRPADGELLALPARQRRHDVAACRRQRLSQRPGVRGGLGGPSSDVGPQGEGRVAEQADAPEGHALDLDVEDHLEE